MLSTDVVSLTFKDGQFHAPPAWLDRENCPEPAADGAVIASGSSRVKP
jgi:hypothetical protein